MSQNKIDTLFRLRKPLVKRPKAVKAKEQGSCSDVVPSPAASSSCNDVTSPLPKVVSVPEIPSVTPPPPIKTRSSARLQQLADKSDEVVKKTNLKTVPNRPAVRSPSETSNKSSAKAFTKSSDKSSPKPSKTLIKPSAKSAKKSTSKSVLGSSQRVLRQRRFTRNTVLTSDDKPLQSSFSKNPCPPVPRRSARRAALQSTLTFASSTTERRSRNVHCDALSPNSNSSTTRKSAVVIESVQTSTIFHTPPVASKSVASAPAPSFPRRPDEIALEPSPAVLPPAFTALSSSPAVDAVSPASPPEAGPLTDLPITTLSRSPSTPPSNHQAEERPSRINIALFGNDGFLGSDVEDDYDEDEQCEVRHERHIDPGNDPLLKDILAFADDFSK